MILSNIIGRLGADAEQRTSKNGNSFVSMRVATNEYVSGENVTTWVNVIWTGERAIKMCEHLKKGSMVNACGSLRTSMYTNKNGERAVSIDLYADRVDFVSSGGNSAQTTSETASQETGTFKNVSAPQTATPKQEVVVNANAVDDLPF